MVLRLLCSLALVTTFGPMAGCGGLGCEGKGDTYSGDQRVAGSEKTADELLASARGTFTREARWLPSGPDAGAAASDAAPRFPFSGATSIQVELEPLDDVFSTEHANEHEEGCELSSREVSARAHVSTDDGALDEQFEGILRVRRNQLVFQARLDSTRGKIAEFLEDFAEESEAGFDEAPQLYVELEPQPEGELTLHLVVEWQSAGQPPERLELL